MPNKRPGILFGVNIFTQNRRKPKKANGIIGSYMEKYGSCCIIPPITCICTTRILLFVLCLDDCIIPPCCCCIAHYYY